MDDLSYVFIWRQNHTEKLFQVTLKNNKLSDPTGIDLEVKKLCEKNP